MFSQPLANFKNETKMKSSLRARGVSGALRSLRILLIGRIGSDRKNLRLCLVRKLQPNVYEKR